MEARSQRPNDREGALSSLNVAIEAVNLAKEVSSITPAKAVFGFVSALLTMIRVRFSLYDRMYQVHVLLGLHAQQAGLRRTRVSLRRRM